MKLIVTMMITEEMKRNLPPITEEELKEIRLSKEEGIKFALEEFEKGIQEDELNNCDDNDTMSIEEAKERTIESVRKIYEENGFNEEEFDLSKYLDSIPYEELKNQYEDYSSYEIINGFDTLPEDLSNQINEDDDR